MPDIFVPLDTTSVSQFYREVMAKNILYRYTMEYTDQNRSRLTGVANVKELNQLLDAEPDLVGGLISYAAKQGVKIDYQPTGRERNLLMAQIRAYIGRNATFDYSGYYSNIYVIDSTMLKALEVLED